MKKALMLATVASTIDQFNMSNIRILLELGYEVHVACNFERGSSSSPERVEQFKAHLTELGILCHHIDFSRKVTEIGANLAAYRQLRRLFNAERFDLVHCHSPIGAALCRLAAQKYRRRGTRVIYTAHGFHFFRGAPRRNWLLYYPMEKLCSRFTDLLITINEEDDTAARKRLHAKEVLRIPGVGIDVARFAKSEVGRGEMREALGIPEDAFLLFSVGELNPNKNHEVVIRALAELGDDRVYYMIAGRGALAESHLALAEELGLGGRVKLLGFRSDIAALCSASDAFVFPSLREGLGLAAVEGMASGLPLIVLDNRGTRDFARNGENAIVCYRSDPAEFARAIGTLAADPERCREMGRINADKAWRYDVGLVEQVMRRVYAGEAAEEAGTSEAVPGR